MPGTSVMTSSEGAIIIAEMVFKQITNVYKVRTKAYIYQLQSASPELRQDSDDNRQVM